MDYNDLLVAERINEIALRKHQQGWVEAHDAAAKNPELDPIEVADAWATEHPVSSFIEQVFTELAGAAMQIRELEKAHCPVFLTPYLPEVTD